MENVFLTKVCFFNIKYTNLIELILKNTQHYHNQLINKKKHKLFT